LEQGIAGHGHPMPAMTTGTTAASIWRHETGAI
jgi:hypothetical protein